MKLAESKCKDIYYEQNYISGHILAVYEWGPFNIVYGIGIPVFYVSSMR